MVVRSNPELTFLGETQGNYSGICGNPFGMEKPSWFMFTLWIGIGFRIGSSFVYFAFTLIHLGVGSLTCGFRFSSAFSSSFFFRRVLRIIMIKEATVRRKRTVRAATRPRTASHPHPTRTTLPSRPTTTNTNIRARQTRSMRRPQAPRTSLPRTI